MRRFSVMLLALFLVSGLVAMPAYAESEKGPRCTDGIDNDLDGLIDADDPDCGADSGGGGGAMGYVGWSDATFTGAQAGAVTFNAACQAKFGAGARWATAIEVLEGNPVIDNAVQTVAWVRTEFIGRDAGGRYQYRYGVTYETRLGCEINSLNGAVVDANGRFPDRRPCDSTAVPLQVACYGLRP